MKRMKRHKIKTEKPEASASHSRDFEEHDLAYYIHDRVELMHQVFSILKYKEIKAMAPQSVRDLAVGDLQELCTEELLGISSKRLVAILDGAEPPSDTESSSQSPTPDRYETISLDSISSDEEILSQSSKKKKHKHSKSKSKKKRDKQKAKDNAEAKPDETTEVSKASRAGLTVLELLELQARARAIRAQLQNEQHIKKQSEQSAVEADSSGDDDAVEIKEETPDVVEISSGDEKPDLNTLQAQVQNTAKQMEPQKPAEPPKTKEVAKPKDTKTKDAKKKDKAKKNSKKETNKAKDNSEQKETSEQTEAPIPGETVPEEAVAKDTSQLKSTVTRIASGDPTEKEANTSQLKSTVTKRVSDLIITVPQTPPSRKIKLNRNKLTVTVPNPPETNVTESQMMDDKIDKKKKLKKNKKKKNLEKDGSDHDEITLQLSDSEKMDLLEDLHEKSYKLSSSADSESSSSDTDIDTSNENISNPTETVSEKFEIEVTDNENTSEMFSSTDKEIEINNDTEIAQSEIKDNVENKATELTITSNEQSNLVDANKSVRDSESNTSNNVQGPVHVSPVLSEENDDNTSANVISTNIDNNQGKNDNLQDSENLTYPTKETNVCEIQIRTEESNENIISELNKVSSSDLTKINSEELVETDISMKEAQKDTAGVEKHLASEQIKTLDMEPENTEVKNTEMVDNVETNTENMIEIKTIADIPITDERNKEIDSNAVKASISDKGIDNDKNMSEGEISDRESSEVEAVDIEPEVVCISDDDAQKSKKKKKKEKKAKKDKKSKKSKKDFRERGDQNFYKDSEKLINIEFMAVDTTEKPLNAEPITIADAQAIKDIKAVENADSLKVSDTEAIDISDDDVYEILELSDDSSCYEVEGTVLSKEPTAEEIAALSATIDDINEDEEAIYDHNESEKDGNISGESDKDTVMSWKDRYLGSSKVKRVLTTANILNALRKKNKQLKKKIEESKHTNAEINKDSKEIHAENTETNVTDEIRNTEIDDVIEEGSIEQYQTLPSLPKYVTNTDNIENTDIPETETETDISKEMKRDAKQLFKIYKKLMYSKKAKRSEKKRLRKVRKRIEKDGLHESL